MRILPHHQNTGGFFVAVLEKVAECPRLYDSTGASGTESTKDDTPVESTEKSDSVVKEDSASKLEVNEDSNSNSNAPEEEKDSEGTEKKTGESAEEKRPYSPPPNVKVKNSAYIEDPFVFMSWEKDRELLDNLKSFYGFDDTFPFEQVGYDFRDFTYSKTSL